MTLVGLMCQKPTESPKPRAKAVQFDIFFFFEIDCSIHTIEIEDPAAQDVSDIDLSDSIAMSLWFCCSQNQRTSHCSHSHFEHVNFPHGTSEIENRQSIIPLCNSETSRLKKLKKTSFPCHPPPPFQTLFAFLEHMHFAADFLAMFLQLPSKWNAWIPWFQIELHHPTIFCCYIYPILSSQNHSFFDTIPFQKNTPCNVYVAIITAINC